jgi:hypothetical protein
MYRTLAVNKDYAENNFRLPRLNSICSDGLGDSPGCFGYTNRGIPLSF